MLRKEMLLENTIRKIQMLFLNVSKLFITTQIYINDTNIIALSVILF